MRHALIQEVLAKFDSAAKFGAIPLVAEYRRDAMARTHVSRTPVFMPSCGLNAIESP